MSVDGTRRAAAMGAFDRLKNKAEELREKAKPMAESLKDKAEHASESIKSKVNEFGDPGAPNPPTTQPPVTESGPGDAPAQ
jgi:hypothetical protein